MNKKILFYGFVILIIILTTLYLLGSIAENRRNKANLEYYNQLLEEDYNLQEIVERNLRMKGLVNMPGTQNGQVKYSVEDLNIIHNTTPEDIIEYGKKLADALSVYGPERNNEVVVVLEVIVRPDINLILELEQANKIHKQALEKIKDMRVPQSAQLNHLRLMNNIQRLENHSRKMANILNEPEEGLQSSEEYIREMINFFRVVEGINVYFSGRGIIFDEGNMVNIYDSLGLIRESS